MSMTSPFSVPTLLRVKDVSLQDHIGEGDYIFSVGYGENASQADNNDHFFGGLVMFRVVLPTMPAYCDLT